MQKRSEAEWAELVTECRESGQAEAEWCKAKGINLYTFRGKKSKVSKNVTEAGKKRDCLRQRKPATAGIAGGCEDTPVKWVSLVQEAKSGAGTESRRKRIDSGAVRISIGAFTIRAGTDFDESTFVRVCKVLKTLC